jgi:hypothetical protein
MEEQIVEVQGQLEAIKAGANTLLHANWIEAPDPALQAQLVRIWETAQELQLQLAQPGALEGYRQDALEQIARVYELIGEYNQAPDSGRLVQLRLSLELAADRIDTYQQVAGAVLEAV